MERKKLKDFVIAFDFDGTITNEDHVWPNCGTPNKEMIDVINFLYDHGFLITINSLRGEGDPVPFFNMHEFLAKNNVGYDYVNESPQHHIDAFGGAPKGDPRKISAGIYVDDRNAGGLASPRQIMKDVIVRYQKRIEKGYAMFDDVIDGDFINAYVEKYVNPVCKTTLRRSPNLDHVQY